jgi:hypothetical protein
VQAGIVRVVTRAIAEGDAHWNESLEKSISMFEEVGIEYAVLDSVTA